MDRYTRSYPHRYFRVVAALFAVVALILLTSARPGFAQTSTGAPSLQEQLKQLQLGLEQLEQSLQDETIRIKSETVDAAIFAKGLRWALDYDREFNPADLTLMQKALDRARERLLGIQSDQPRWRARRGKMALGYVSKIDNSVQPYGLIVPRGYDKLKPLRLDVVLHGSTRPVGLSELRFMARFEEGDADNAAAPDLPFIELHPLGRVENCYRWAGETDVFEAIEDVCRRFQIDRDRIVLRGMSMGASGTWHLGLKHPDRFVALGPYCGYVDTHRFSETPLPNFVKVGPLPEHQELGLHMLDSVDYAANAGVVPVVACMGEKDIFFDAHVIMGQAFEKEGLKFVNLISPGTGHVIDPVTHAEQMRRIAGYVESGLNHKPDHMRFVTWTLKYSRCHWLQIQGLERHYQRAEVSAKFEDQVLTFTEPLNVTRFAIQLNELPSTPTRLRVGKSDLELPQSRGTQLTIVKQGTNWKWADSKGLNQTEGKRPGMQGPIDDAFSSPFLCVRGTGTPWNASIKAYSDASLKRFASEWRHYFRGDLPVKDDTAVTAEDIRSKNLILFGDPGSNSWLAKVLPDLPISWTHDKLLVNGVNYDATNHAPALICPNPLPGASERYLVINSGHSFREAELAKLNYLLFPRWGDWAVLKVGSQQTEPDAGLETVIQAGYFGEDWKLNSPR